MKLHRFQVSSLLVRVKAMTHDIMAASSAIRLIKKMLVWPFVSVLDDVYLQKETLNGVK